MPIDLFKRGGGQRAAIDLNVPFLGAIPLDPAIVMRGDAGEVIYGDDTHPSSAKSHRRTGAESKRSGQRNRGLAGVCLNSLPWRNTQTPPYADRSMRALHERVYLFLWNKWPQQESTTLIEAEREQYMQTKTVAIPSQHPGGLEALRSGHFGHCDVFTLVKIGKRRDPGCGHRPRTCRMPRVGVPHR